MGSWRRSFTCDMEAQGPLLDPPNLMVPAPRDPGKTKAARAALDAMKVRTKLSYI